MLGEFLPSAIEYLDLQVTAEDIDLSSTIQFLSLNGNKRKTIDPLLGNPLSIFLPLNEDRFFIDYAWIREILENLFFNLKLSDQNFKGEALRI